MDLVRLDLVCGAGVFFYLSHGHRRTTYMPSGKEYLQSSGSQMGRRYGYVVARKEDARVRDCKSARNRPRLVIRRPAAGINRRAQARTLQGPFRQLIKGKGKWCIRRPALSPISGVVIRGRGAPGYHTTVCTVICGLRDPCPLMWLIMGGIHRRAGTPVTLHCSPNSRAKQGHCRGGHPRYAQPCLRDGSETGEIEPDRRGTPRQHSHRTHANPCNDRPLPASPPALPALEGVRPRH